MIIEKNYSKSDLRAIEDFVLKKFSVPDVYKLKDRYEGELFLNNTIKKVLIFWTFLEQKEINYYRKIKIGFLSTVDFSELTKINLNYLDNKKELYDIKDFELDRLYAFVDIENKRCCLAGADAIFKSSNENIDLYLKNFNPPIFI